MMKIVKLILSLTVIAAVCAGVLASVNAVTKETIKGIRAQQTLDAAAQSVEIARQHLEALGVAPKGLPIEELARLVAAKVGGFD